MKKKLQLGFYDDPKRQTQDIFSVNLVETHIAIFGTSSSGKTTALKTLLVRLHENARKNDKEHVYILDFFGHLNRYATLPFVVAYFDNSNEENIRRLFKKVEEVFAQNKKELKGSTYSEVKVEDRPLHMTLIIDGLNAFLAEERFSAYHDKLLKLSREGRSNGLTVIFTATETTGGVSRYLSAFGTKITFDMPNDKYSEIYGLKTHKPMLLPGRGIINKDISTYEFQCFLPFDDRKIDIDELYLLSEKAEQQCTYVAEVRTKKMASFDGDLTKDKIINFDNTWIDSENGTVTIGLDYYSFQPMVLNLKLAQSIAIYGKKGFGKKNLLSLILKSATQIADDVRFVFWDDSRNKLKEFYQYETDSVPNPNYLKNFNSGVELISLVSDVAQKRNIAEDLALKQYVTEHGYCNLLTSTESKGTVFEKSDSNPFTVFIIQNKSFYHVTGLGGGASIIAKLSSFIRDAVSHNALFIFSDVQKIIDAEVNMHFNNSISHVFLLDDILQFVSERGQRSVFGDMDRNELKESFGKCEVGDGYYYDLYDLSKLKILKD